MIGAGRALYILVIVSLVVGLCSPVFAVDIIGVGVSSVSVSPTTVQPGQTISISVKAQSGWEEYSIYIVYPNGLKVWVEDGKGSDTYSWTVPSDAKPGTYTVLVKPKSDYYNTKSTTFTVVSTTTTASSGGWSIEPEAPPALKSAVNRFLGLLMFIGWAVVIGGVVAAAIMHVIGKEAPQILGRVIVAAFIMAFGVTIIWWITS